METKDIVVRVEVHYGTKRYYPINNNAIIFSNIAGGKTLTADTLKRTKRLGYNVIQKFNEEL